MELTVAGPPLWTRLGDRQSLGRWADPPSAAVLKSKPRASFDTSADVKLTLRGIGGSATRYGGLRHFSIRLSISLQLDALFVFLAGCEGAELQQAA